MVDFPSTLDCKSGTDDDDDDGEVSPTWTAFCIESVASYWQVVTAVVALHSRIMEKIEGGISVGQTRK